LSSNEEGAAVQAPRADEAPQADEARPANEAARANDERVGHRRPPLATRFRSGLSGNPRGRPKRARHLGAVVAAALRERVAVTETDGRIRRISKLEATVKQIVDGAVAGDARSTTLLFALIKADERALTEPDASRRDEIANEADAIVIAELRRRLTGDDGSGAKGSDDERGAGRSGAKARRSLLQSFGTPDAAPVRGEG